jgi:plasmid stabilization system protein ParE
VDFKILYTESALAELETVMRWSWESHPLTSERFATELLNHVDLLADLPYLGAQVKGFSGVRRLLHSPIYVYYSVDESRMLIEILHFWHAARRNPDF